LEEVRRSGIAGFGSQLLLKRLWGDRIGIHPPNRAKFSDFLKALHTVSLAQGESFRAIKAASSKATVGSA
jgi:beta-glucosidase/6-phospho-beta-glucosidase/beta-galactosidase